MFEFKTLLVENLCECPLCGRTLHIGDTMFKDDYRGETLCCYCIDNYKENIISEEGVDGRLIK